jgi:hypothetical protein
MALAECRPDMRPARATKVFSRVGSLSSVPLLSLTRRAHERPGLSLIPIHMAWRPYSNLLSGELDNRTPGKVTGWINFFRLGGEPLRVTFDLTGDFHEDIRGKVIRLKNPNPSDRNTELGRDGTYMDGFSPMQCGTVGDITAGLPLGVWTEELAQRFIAQNEIIWEENGLGASEREKRRQRLAEHFRQRIEQGGLCFAYSDYPYVEWYSDENGRVVLELDASQVEILEGQSVPVRRKTPKDLVKDRRKRDQAMDDFMSGMVKDLSQENRKNGGDGNVFGAVI